MKITIINGQNHKGSTWQIGHMLAEKLGGEVTEFFLPRDFSDYCVGCAQCFEVGAERCPHYEKQQGILRALDEADVIILTSPVYVYHASAPMKNFLDHQGHRWMAHRPQPGMFRKQTVCITTAAGAGTKSAARDMADSLRYWGAARIYRLGFSIQAISWRNVKPAKKAVIEKKVSALAGTILRREGNVQPELRTKAIFYLMRMLHQRQVLSKNDTVYWMQQGWLGKQRPWKQNKT